MSERALDGRHESLSRIFGKECHFLIDMTRNLRGYSWGTERVARLVEDIDDFRPDVDIEDDMYDLGQVIFTKAEKKDLSAYQNQAVHCRKDCFWYYAHDGQQRLTTTYIVLLAIVQEIDARKGNGKIPAELQKKFGQLRCDLVSAVKPTTRFGTRIARIVSSVSWLTKLVDSIPEEEVNDGPEEEAVESPIKKQRVEPPTRAEDKEEDSKPPAAAVRRVVSPDSEECTINTTAYKPRHLSSAAAAADQEDTEERKKVEQAFAKCKEILGEMDTDRLDNFCEKILDFTSVLVCVATSTKTANRLVMGQRHGMNIEDVDYCKGYLCRNELCLDEPASQLKTEQLWNKLCSATSRQTVLSAALTVAQIDMGELARDTEGKHAVDFFEKFVKDKFNNHQERAPESCCGAIFKRISKAAWKIHHLGKAAKSGEDGDIAGLCDGMSDVKAKIMPSMRFLVGLVASKTQAGKVETVAGKAVQLAFVAVLLRVDPNRLPSLLSQLEPIALWLVLAPAKKERSDRVLEFIKQIGHQSAGEGAALSLRSEEKRAVRELLEGVFSDSNPGNRIPKAILERLNVHEQQKEDANFVVWEDEVQVQVFLDVMQRTTNTTKYRLVNFFLSTNKPARNRRKVNDKKSRASTSIFPLSKWAFELSWENPADIEEHSNHIMKVANEVWGLGGARRRPARSMP